MPAFSHRAPIRLAIDSSLAPTCSLPTRKRISNCGTVKSLMLLLRSQQAAGSLRNQTCPFPSREGLHHGHVLHMAVPRATDQIDVHVMPFGGPVTAYTASQLQRAGQSDSLPSTRIQADV